ncbi:carbohydrate ABC transporter permease [Plantactinospora sp. DSM 117369]
MTAPIRPPRLTRRVREQIAGYLFTAPLVLGFLAIVIGPLVMVGWYSLHHFETLTGQFTFAGADNYEALADDPRLPGVLVATGVFVVCIVPLGISLSLLLAVLVNQKLPAIKVFRAIFFAPTLVSLAAWTIVWHFLLLPNGAVNSLLRTLSIHGPDWLREPGAAMAAVIVVQVLKGAGMNMLIFLAALQSVPKELTESARVDGAGRFRTFRSITLPIISPEILMAVMLMTIGAFKVFEQILLLTGGGPGYSTTVLIFYIYRQAFGTGDLGYAGALSLLMFAILLLLTAGLWQLRKKVVFYESD